MKKQIIILVLITFGLYYPVTNVKAQGEPNEFERGFRMRGAGPCFWNNQDQEAGIRGIYNIPGLSDNQKEEINNLRLKHQKELRQLRALLSEKRARLNTLRLADNPDLKEINDVIDEITGLQGKIMKAREKNRNEMRAKLNDEQKDWFDSRPGRGMGYGYKNREGYNRRADFGRQRGVAPYENCLYYKERLKKDSNSEDNVD